MILLVFLAALVLAFSATGAVALLVFVIPSITIDAIPVTFTASFIILFVLILVFYLTGKVVEREGRRAELQTAILAKAREEGQFTSNSD